MNMDFKKWLKVFLFNGSFGDTEFCYFSVDQSWLQWCYVSNSYIITVVKDVHLFSQSIARQKIKELQLQAIMGTWLT